MAEATGRAQDQGRRHRAKGRPSPATSTLLADYQAAMRDELRDVLAELRGVEEPSGLFDVAKIDGTDASAIMRMKRPAIAERIRLWDLAIKVGRELGTEIEPPAQPEPTSPAASGRPRRRGRIDYGGQ